MGFTPAHVDLIVDAGFGTMAKLAFACNFSPGATDETPLVTLATTVLGQAPTASELGTWRRLFFEAYTLSANDLRTRLDRPEDSAPRRLAAPERAHRFDAQVLRLRGLNLENELECSDALIDTACQMYDDNRLAYIPWELCTRKNQEIAGIKKDPTLKFDSGGVVRLVPAETHAQAPLATEMQIKYALQRRGLALDQASLLTFSTHEVWIDKMFFYRSKVQPQFYDQISLVQLYNADQALFVKLCRTTRGGIIPLPDGTRPLDKALKLAIDDTDVMHLLIPFQSHGTSRAMASTDNAPGDLGKGSRGKGQGKIKGVQKVSKQKVKGAGKDSRSGSKGDGSPKGKGKGRKASTNASGERICWPYNGGGCTEATTLNAAGIPQCSRGLHVCARSGCFARHPMSDPSCPLWG